ncbi:MAG: flagellar biosynthesis anti-sigma factor FlgM [Candidatus Puniceispirillaceae bacterium]|jgi:negative regulator of flagellin synthesis FlgM
MVDAIKTTVNRLELTKGRASDGRPANAGTPAVAASPSVDDVTVSEAASAKSQIQLAQTPPVDNEAVRRIKDAIERGEYPIDVDLISEALMDAYRDMKA